MYDPNAPLYERTGLFPLGTEERGPIFTDEPIFEDHGTSRRWMRVIRGRLYSFTAVLMPDGERRYFVNRFDGTDQRFDCEWTHEILAWTIKP